MCIRNVAIEFQCLNTKLRFKNVMEFKLVATGFKIDSRGLERL